MKKKTGFSLIEVIIAITIVAVIGVITTTITTRVFRINSQNGNVSRLKENGDRAINYMGETIRSSERVVCYSNELKSIVVRSRAGKFIKFRFVDPDPVTGTPNANGYIAKQENLDPDDEANFCNILTSPSPVPITDTNTTNGVSVSNGRFARLSGSASKDTVRITFYVNSNLKPLSPFSSESAWFETVIQVR